MKHGKGLKKETAAKKSGKTTKTAPKQKRPAKSGASKAAGPSGRGSARSSAAAARPDLRAARSGPVNFSNPLVANAFRRAVKKYSAAFKRLTD